MPQIFRPASNTVAWIILPGFVLFFFTLLCGGYAVVWSPYSTRVGIPIEQPVPFSHEHHVAGLGIDCRYCHTSVEESAFAGLPPTHTCMTCHSQVWKDAPVLAPVRASLASGVPLKWNRIHDLPDFVYFNHSIHVAKGIGCSTCHGAVNEMPLTWKTESLYMQWCLDCHRNPEQFIRPRDQVFNMSWTPQSNQLARGFELVREFRVHSKQITDCSTCHR
jgi:hypothetical protein